MKKKFLALFLTMCMIVPITPIICHASDNDEIVIFYENDVHCSIDGYSKLAAMRNEQAETLDTVGVVSSGDFVQGSSIGAISKGEYIVNIMNLVGYDAVAPGNHEFDYKTERLYELTEMLNAPVVCSNFKSTSDNTPIFNPYTIVSYGYTDVAYIGITTPDTITSSSPSQFKNSEDEYIFSFSGDSLYDTVQKYVDEARSEGADYVIALSHLGTENVYEEWSSQTLVKNTSGIDVVLDGHSHSVVENLKISDKNGNDVIISSTGTGFANIGKLTIDNGDIKTELIPTSTYDKTNNEVDAYIDKINEEYQALGNRVIGKSEVYLTTRDADGNRIIRNTETNLGDFCADAYRVITGADIGFINGGGIRADIATGDVTFNDLLSVFPYNNKTCVSEVTGQQIADMLELAVMIYPEENGSFQHVSGLTFDLDPTVCSSVSLNENQEFVSVDGDRRVSNIKVLDKTSGEYKPLDYNQKYMLASHSYLLTEYGGGATMFKNSTLVSDEGILDIELLESYITENLNGVISEEYKESQNRINVLDEYVPLRKNFEDMGYEVIWTEFEPDKIIVNTADCTMIFNAGTNTVIVNDKIYEVDRTTYITDGTTYISADCLAL